MWQKSLQRILHLWQGAESEGRARKEDKWPDVGVSQEVRGKRITYSPIDFKRCCTDVALRTKNNLTI